MMYSVLVVLYHGEHFLYNTNQAKLTLELLSISIKISRDYQHQFSLLAFLRAIFNCCLSLENRTVVGLLYLGGYKKVV